MSLAKSPRMTKRKLPAIQGMKHSGRQMETLKEIAPFHYVLEAKGVSI
jgi:hypothetical protein